MKREKNMKKILLLAGVASLVAANVSATEYNPYVAARFARVNLQNDAYQYTYATSVRSDIVNKEINDEQFGYRFAAGVMVPLCGGLAQSVRAELEYGLLNKSHNTGVWNLNMPQGAVMAGNYSIQTKIQTVFANFYYDLDTGTSVTPYFGFGLGYARINEKASVSVPSVQYAANAKGSEDNFAYNIGAGVSVNLTYNMDVEVGYRYTDYGQIKNRTSGDYAKRSYDSHEVLLGLRYTF